MLKKTLILIALFSLIFAFSANAAELGKWRAAQDKPTGDDKCIHALGSGFLCYQFNKRYTLSKAIGYTMLTGFVWECKDALVPWEKIGYWGGDGFSTWDLAWDFGGVLIYVLGEAVIPRRDVRLYAAGRTVGILKEF